MCNARARARVCVVSNAWGKSLPPRAAAIAAGLAVAEYANRLLLFTASARLVYLSQLIDTLIVHVL